MKPYLFVLILCLFAFEISAQTPTRVELEKKINDTKKQIEATESKIAGANTELSQLKLQLEKYQQQLKELPSGSTVITNTTAAPGVITEKYYVEVFSKPNFQGQKITIPWKRHPNHPSLHFSQPAFDIATPENSTNVSLRFSHPQLCAVIGDNDGNAFFVHHDLANLHLSSGKFKRILVDSKTQCIVGLETILTEIHNNDCKKLYGTIEADVFFRTDWGVLPAVLLTKEKAISGSPYLTQGQSENPLVPSLQGIYYRAKVFNRPKAEVETSGEVPGWLQDMKTYYYGNDDKGLNKFSYFAPPSGTGDRDIQFILPSSYTDGFNKGAVFLKTRINIGTAHKGCDVCTDFTWNCTMTSAKEVSTEMKYLQDTKTKDKARYAYFLGPFRKLPGEFRQTAHATYVVFRDGVWTHHDPK